MRVLLLALMITLLPLRSWVGDVMAMEQVSAAMGHAHGAAPSADHHDRAPCQGHDGGPHATPAMDHDSPHADGDCASCTACQICHAVALAGMPTPALATALPASAPHTQAVLHASAERAPGFKPPIF